MERPKVTPKDVVQALVLSGGLIGGGLMIRQGVGLIARDMRPGVVEAPGALNREPKGIFPQLMLVREGVNIRNYPAIPIAPKLRIPRVNYQTANTLRWSDIETVNGVPLNGARMFTIANPEMVEGEEPDKHFNRPGQPSYPGRWIRVRIKAKGQSQEKPYFISVSQQTAEHVSRIDNGYWHLDAQDRNQAYLLVQYGSRPVFVLNKSDVGVVTAVQKEEEIKILWEKRMADKLDGKAPPSDYSWSRRYDEVEIVPSGWSWEDIVKMKQENRPVKVKDYSSHQYPDKKPVQTVAYVKLGTRIKDVYLLDYSWIVFRGGSVQGEVYDANGNVLQLEKDRVYAIDSEFALDATSPRLRGEQEPWVNPLAPQTPAQAS